MAETTPEQNTETIDTPTTTIHVDEHAAQPAAETPASVNSAPAPAIGAAADPKPAEPSILPPSPMVQPFDSAGGPPPPPTAPKKNHMIPLLVIVVLLLAAAAGAYFIFNGSKLGFSTPKASPPTPKPSVAVADSLTTSFQGIDTSLSDANSNIASVDASLKDQQGNLSE